MSISTDPGSLSTLPGSPTLFWATLVLSLKWLFWMFFTFRLPASKKQVETIRVELPMTCSPQACKLISHLCVSSLRPVPCLHSVFHFSAPCSRTWHNQLHFLFWQLFTALLGWASLLAFIHASVSTVLTICHLTSLLSMLLLVSTQSPFSPSLLTCLWRGTYTSPLLPLHLPDSIGEFCFLEVVEHSYLKYFLSLPWDHPLLRFLWTLWPFSFSALFFSLICINSVPLLGWCPKDASNSPHSRLTPSPLP